MVALTTAVQLLHNRVAVGWTLFAVLLVEPALYSAGMSLTICQLCHPGNVQVDGHPRPDLVYMPQWTASWDVKDIKLPSGKARCNHHVRMAVRDIG